VDEEQVSAHPDGDGLRTTERIVGIGASAGGLESLEQLFAALPNDTGMAFVVVQHLSHDFRSLMDELIARHSDMPVHVAEDGMAVEANCIYLMPPRKEMIVRDRRLWLADKEPHTFSLPIDAFFRSLAQDVGPQAVAIVLSGSGSDGSRGIVDVKRAGGLVLAETPTSAKFDGMPLSAAESGAVDHTHAPSDLARLLCGLAPLETATENEALSEDPSMDSVLRLLRDNFGIDFSLYKMTTVGRRIQRRVEILRLAGLPQYVEQLFADPDELNKLYQDLLIGVTQFFRDPEAFETLEHDIIPKLLDQLKPEDELRVWIAGCATGEEAYSLAMLFWEAFKARERPMRVKILATDVHQRSLDYASTGVYGEEQLAHVTAPRLERFFTKRSAGYHVSPELRQLIVFARHNVTKDAPFTKMHFISCRNMLIYLQPQAQRTVLSLFHFGLVSGGTLFLGASETPGVLSDEFTIVNDHWKIFRKRRDVHLLGQVRLPVVREPARRPATLDLPRVTGTDPAILSTYDQLLDLFMPPGLLVDEDRMLLDAFGGAEKLLRMRRRRPTNHVLELLSDDLRTVVAGAMQRALKDRSPVSYSGVRIPTDAGELRYVVSARPLHHPRNGANVLITFREMTDGEQAKPAVERSDVTAAPIEMSEASQERMATLESELQYTRETLQATIEELETSNEEMQATNEELVASNEELQSTNEELHSVNEELYTVNAEYQQKISELKELNADMAHLLEGTDVGTVFLDRDLRIRRFTSRIANVFRFQQHDIGRRIGDFSHNIERHELMDEIANALDKGTIVEDEVHDRAGTPYFLRILPYRVNPRSNNGFGLELGPIEGVVLTLTDMTALDKARTKVEQLSAIVESSNDAILATSLDGTITSWNRGAEQLYGYTAEDAVGKHARILMRPGCEHELDRYLHHIARGDKVEHVASLCVRQDGSQLDASVMFSPVFNHAKIVGAAAIARDISRLTATQRELEEQQRTVEALLAASEQNAHRREKFLAMLSHELRNPLAAVLSATSALRETPSAELAVRCQSVIERQATHMKRLLDDMLDVSRITSDKFELNLEPLDLRDVIETAAEATEPAFRDRRVTLECTTPGHVLAMKGDTRRLTQVIANLLSNAASYSAPGTSVQLDVSLEGDSVLVRVVDRGEGIDAALQPKIFDLFVQSDQKLDRSRGGLGVGLSLAKTIAELHGGSISVHSDGPGKGSEFVVRLPLGPVGASVATRAPGGPCRVVLVDDQEDSRDMLRMLLEKRNHVVFDAADGAHAVQLIAQQKPDVAFIDIGLPILDGFEVAQQIRRQPELEGVLLVALSGYGTHSDIEAAIAAGFDDHVTKPAELTRLEQILARKKYTTTTD
jgi:two-component system, chemotaxis family, CheB/CheR fusion protein